MRTTGIARAGLEIRSAPSELEETDLTIVSLEAAVGNRQRIDVEVGSTVIEVKRDQRDKFAMRAYAAAQHQLDMIFASHYKETREPKNCTRRAASSQRESAHSQATEIKWPTDLMISSSSAKSTSSL
jgi:hypothetical protein